MVVAYSGLTWGIANHALHFGFSGFLFHDDSSPHSVLLYGRKCGGPRKRGARAKKRQQMPANHGIRIRKAVSTVPIMGAPVGANNSGPITKDFARHVCIQYFSIPDHFVGAYKLKYSLSDGVLISIRTFSSF